MLEKRLGKLAEGSESLRRLMRSATMTGGLGRGWANVGTRPERWPKDQDRTGRHDAALSSGPGLVPMR